MMIPWPFHEFPVAVERSVSSLNNWLVLRPANGWSLFYMICMCTVRAQYLDNTRTVWDHVCTVHGLQGTSSHKQLNHCPPVIDQLLTNIWIIHKQSRIALSVPVGPGIIRGLYPAIHEGSQTDRTSGGVLRDAVFIHFSVYNDMAMDRNNLWLWWDVHHVTLELYLLNFQR